MRTHSSDDAVVSQIGYAISRSVCNLRFWENITQYQWWCHHNPPLMGPRTCMKTFRIGDAEFLGYQIKMTWTDDLNCKFPFVLNTPLHVHSLALITVRTYLQAQWSRVYPNVSAHSVWPCIHQLEHSSLPAAPPPPPPPPPTHTHTHTHTHTCVQMKKKWWDKQSHSFLKMNGTLL